MRERDDQPGHRGRRTAAALILLALGAAAVAAYVVASRGDREAGGVAGVQADFNYGGTTWPELAPAFSGSQLTALPTNAWLTNGGNAYNQRYSPLTQINATNVSQLKGVWMTDLRGSAVGGRYSGESQPVYYNGVLYVTTGENDVFAVDVDDGRILWQYDGNLDPGINTICCGWLNRGVAIGEGKVYMGKLDGSLVALDQRTGQEVWKVQVGRWQEGFTLTPAPLYYNGMVIIGSAGGEYSIRGSVTAYRASTGERLWRFYTIPGPGEVGSTTWPQDNDAWTHGGAPVWQTPAVDPELGLIYFSTGNASPDLDGSNRAGNNLFAASIVAIEAATGRYRWHFQQVHHDIWDWDAPSPVVLFNVRVPEDDDDDDDDDDDGGDSDDFRIVRGIAEAGKTGWLYMLNRETGRPILPISERQVPQDPDQKTAPTQPIPSYPPFIPHEVSDVAYQQIVDLANRRFAARGLPTPPIRRMSPGMIFEPFDTNEIVVITPGPQGGVNWPPISYNRERQRFFVCAVGGVSGYTRSGTTVPAERRGTVADVGSTFTTTGFGNQVGYFAAIDAVTGRIVWRHRWPESCYSGTVTTAGDIVFVGRNSGELEAYHVDDGRLLWSFQTGSGANNTPTIFSRNGKQYVAFLSGGNLLAGSPKGDNLWLFALDGTIGPAAPGTGAGTGTHAGEETLPTTTTTATPTTPPTTTVTPTTTTTTPGTTTSPPPATTATTSPKQPTPSPTGDPVAGKTIYANNCAGCHGPTGTGGGGGPSLRGQTNFNSVVAMVTNGGGGMPAFGRSLTQQQIYDVAAYVTQRIATGNP